jgi:hypothetical protein
MKLIHSCLDCRPQRHDSLSSKQLSHTNLQFFHAGATILGDDCGWQMRVDQHKRPAAEMICGM